METGGLRARNRERTRNEIIESALTLFEQKGYDATTCEDIAAKADVSVRTFFRYFDAKVDVVLAGRTDEDGPMRVIADVRDAPATAPIVDVIRHALRHPIAVVEAQRDHVIRQFGVLIATPSLSTLRREQFHRLEDPLAAAIAQRLDRAPDDFEARLVAAATAVALRIGIEDWVTSGAGPGTLASRVHQAFTVLGDALTQTDANGR